MRKCIVKIGEAHIVKNITNNMITVLGIASGEYYGEDDIERLEDDYGRC